MSDLTDDMLQWLEENPRIDATDNNSYDEDDMWWAISNIDDWYEGPYELEEEGS